MEDVVHQSVSLGRFGSGLVLTAVFCRDHCYRIKYSNLMAQQWREVFWFIHPAITGQLVFSSNYSLFSYVKVVTF